MKVSKWLIGSFTLAVAGTVGAAIVYPEDFSIALAFLVLGFGGGMLVSTTLMKSYFTQGVNMAHELQKKQIINPATIMKEARLQEKASFTELKPAPQIPRINITGLSK